MAITRSTEGKRRLVEVHSAHAGIAALAAGASFPLCAPPFMTVVVYWPNISTNEAADCATVGVGVTVLLDMRLWLPCAIKLERAFGRLERKNRD